MDTGNWFPWEVIDYMRKKDTTKPHMTTRRMSTLRESAMKAANTNAIKTSEALPRTPLPTRSAMRHALIHAGHSGGRTCSLGIVSNYRGKRLVMTERRR